MSHKRVVVVANKDAVAESVAARLLGKILVGLGEDRLVHISLTGGGVGQAVLAAIGVHPLRSSIDWTRVHLWWSDERFVPRASEERNATPAMRDFVAHIDIPAGNVHQMPASDEGLTLDEGATAYAAELARFGTAEQPHPYFDVMLLGVGPDGHIASLFPDREEIQSTETTILAVRDSPKPPPERLTMTRPLINSSQRVWMVIAGSEKAGALGLILAGASYDSVPAAGAKGVERTIIITDESAASQVPPSLIDSDF